MFAVNPSDPTPLYAQLERSIRAAIAAHKLGAGDQLPTVRQLAVDLRLNANTVAKVYAELERAGIVATQRGRGTFVRDASAAAATSGKRARDKALRPLVDRLLAEAAIHGITIPEIVQYLTALDSRSPKENTRL